MDCSVIRNKPGRRLWNGPFRYKRNRWGGLGCCLRAAIAAGFLQKEVHGEQ